MERGIDVSEEESDEDSDPYAEEFQQHLQLTTGWQDIEQATIPPISLGNIHKYFVQKRLMKRGGDGIQTI